MACESDWSGIEDDLREWIETMKPKDQWARWARLVKKKPVEHYRNEIKKDEKYQELLASKTPEVPIPPPVSEMEATSSNDAPEHAESSHSPGKRRRRIPKPTIDSHREARKKQRARLEMVAQKAVDAGPESRLVSAARSSAESTNAMHGKAAAAAAGSAAAAQAMASERLERTGIGSVRKARGPQLTSNQQAILSASMQMAGLPIFGHNPLGLKADMDIQSLSNAVRNANERTRVVFEPINSAREEEELPVYRSLGSFRSLSMDSLEEGSSNAERMARVRDCCGSR
jgi:hypothetical protein